VVVSGAAVVAKTALFYEKNKIKMIYLTQKLYYQISSVSVSPHQMGDFLENSGHSLLIDRGFEEAYTA